MSRIIKEGTLQERIMDCPKCGCQFGYNKRDIWREYDATPCIRFDRYYVECPYCHEHLTINAKGQKEAANHPDFIEDVKTLAKQYGYELLNIEVK